MNIKKLSVGSSMADKIVEIFCTKKGEGKDICLKNDKLMVEAKYSLTLWLIIFFYTLDSLGK